MTTAIERRLSMLPHYLKVIDESEYDRIHQATLTLLEHTGVRFLLQEALNIFRDHGARLDGDCVYIPPNLVTQSLERAPSLFQWQARNPNHSVMVGDHAIVQPAAGPIYIYDLQQGHRLGILDDFIKFQKLYQALAGQELVGMIPCDPSDIEQDNKHLILMREILRHTDKPVNGFMTFGHQAQAQLDMMAIAMGGGHILDEHHCIGVSISATSPLMYTQDALETMLHYVRRNQTVHLLTAPLAGTTSPFGMLESVVQQNAEILAGIVLAQLSVPGAPVVYAPSATTMDMRNGALACGKPEGMLINIANIQMAREYYHLPVRAMCGITDAKIPDCQAAAETMQNLMLGMLSGAHLLNEVLGTLDCILTVSFEKTIIDHELISRIRRILNGIEGEDRRIDIDTIQEVGSGGCFLSHPTTITRCRERWEAPVSFTGTHQDWEDEGSLDMVQKASQKCKQILSQAPDCLIDKELDNELDAFVETELRRLG